MKLWSLPLSLLCAVSSCSGGEYRVLFIGNSLTYFNDLPGTVVGLGRPVDDTLFREVGSST